MQGRLGLFVLALAIPAFGTVVGDDLADEGHHHHKGHHHKGHHKHHGGKKVVTAEKPVVKAAVQAQAVHTESSIVDKMKKLEAKLAEKAKAQAVAMTQGHLLVNGPVPADFNERFVQAVGQATSADSSKVHVTQTAALEGNPGIVEVTFEAPVKIVKAVENDAADPNSKLARGNMRPFLVAKDEAPAGATAFSAEKPKAQKEDEKEEKAEEPEAAAPAPKEVTPVEEKGIDIDTSMPYGDLEPFGREDTAQELTESSVKESDEMVDQLERAEVAEEKRAVFRALTRLRGAAITSFDGVARSQTGNIDEYNKVHKWRKTHPLHHLADEESDVSKWAFPDNADF
jgi:hypothetical protein